jgi:hypothetical protein
MGFSASIWKVSSRTSFEVGLLPSGFVISEIEPMTLQGGIKTKIIYLTKERGGAND